MVVLNKDFAAASGKGGVTLLFTLGDLFVIAMSDDLQVKKSQNNHSRHRDYREEENVHSCELAASRHSFEWIFSLAGDSMPAQDFTTIYVQKNNTFKWLAGDFAGSSRYTSGDCAGFSKSWFALGNSQY